MLKRVQFAETLALENFCVCELGFLFFTLQAEPFLTAHMLCNKKAIKEGLLAGCLFLSCAYFTNVNQLEMTTSRNAMILLVRLLFQCYCGISVFVFSHCMYMNFQGLCLCLSHSVNQVLVMLIPVICLTPL